MAKKSAAVASARDAAMARRCEASEERRASAVSIDESELSITALPPGGRGSMNLGPGTHAAARFAAAGKRRQKGRDQKKIPLFRKRFGDKDVCYGALRFPSSRQKPAKWIVVPQLPSADRERYDSLESLSKMLVATWGLSPPSVLISITGGAAASFDMSEKSKLVFRRGLISAAQITQAWIITGGTDVGIMAEVGRTVAQMDVEQPKLIGVAPWRHVHLHSEMDAHAREKGNGTIFEYTRQVGDRSTKKPQSVQFGLDPNHSHFVLVDDDTEEAQWGVEIALRSALEDFLCNIGFKRDHDQNELHKPRKPHMVLLVAGGGPGTLKTTLATLEKERPVVVVRDSGHAAQHLWEWWTAQTCDDKDPAAESTPAYISMLREICELGRVPAGANQVPQLSFFSASEDVVDNNLSMRILKSILSDCERTADAIDLAVSWQEPVTIRNQLDDSKQADPEGLARSLERALISKRADVVEALIDYFPEKPRLVRLETLWRNMHSLEVSSDAEKLRVAIFKLKDDLVAESSHGLHEETTTTAAAAAGEQTTGGHAMLGVSQALTGAGRVLSSIVMPPFVETVRHHLSFPSGSGVSSPGDTHIFRGSVRPDGRGPRRSVEMEMKRVSIFSPRSAPPALISGPTGFKHVGHVGEGDEVPPEFFHQQSAVMIQARIRGRNARRKVRASIRVESKHAGGQQEGHTPADAPRGARFRDSNEPSGSRGGTNGLRVDVGGGEKKGFIENLLSPLSSPFGSAPRRDDTTDPLRQLTIIEYSAHLDARRDFRSRRTWTDVFLWAVVAEQMEIARHLWVKVEEPLRAAIMACRVSLWLAKGMEGEAPRMYKQRLEAARRYEDWAVGMLDEMNKTEARKQLMVIAKVRKRSAGSRHSPAGDTGFGSFEESVRRESRRTSAVGPQLASLRDKWKSFQGAAIDSRSSPVQKAWARSVIEEAIDATGLDENSSLCRRFVAHRNCEWLLEGAFCGEFPGSNLAIHRGAHVSVIFLQLLLLPAWVLLELLRQSRIGERCGIRHWRLHAKLDLLQMRKDIQKDFEEEGFGAVASWSDDEDDDEDATEGAVDDVYLEERQVTRSQHDLLGVASSRAVDNPLLVCVHLWHVPRVKFVVHTTSALAYALLFACVLVGLPGVGQDYMWHAGELPADSLLPGEPMVWMWTVCRLGEEVMQMFRAGATDYFSDTWNRLDLGTYALVLITMLLRCLVLIDCTRFDDSGPWHDCAEEHEGTLRFGFISRKVTLSTALSLYALAVFLVFFRFIHSVKIFSSVGVLALILWRMWGDIVSWAVITGIIMIGAGFTFTILEPGSGLYADALSRPFFRSFWGLLGAFDDYDEIAEKLPPHGPVEPRATLYPILLWMYIFFATVVLVNLLIAQMSSTYDDIRRESLLNTKFDRVSIIQEYKDFRTTLPPPLNALYLVRFISTLFFPGLHKRKEIGFNWLQPAQAAQAVIEQSQGYRRLFLRTKDAEEKMTVDRQFGAMRRALAELEAEQRSQFEALSGRFDLLEKRRQEEERRQTRGRSKSSLAEGLLGRSGRLNLESPPAAAAADAASARPPPTGHRSPPSPELSPATERAVPASGPSTPTPTRPMPVAARAAPEVPRGSRPADASEPPTPEGQPPQRRSSQVGSRFSAII